MKILIVEDKTEEQNSAAQAVEAAGHEATIVNSVWEAVTLAGSVDAVITDMYFHPFGGAKNSYDKYKETVPPAGLCVVILAISQSVPVAVCTDSDHHSKELSFIHDGLLFPLLRGQDSQEVDDFEWLEVYAPFGWIENKNWAKAVAAVEARVASKK